MTFNVEDVRSRTRARYGGGDVRGPVPYWWQAVQDLYAALKRIEELEGELDGWIEDAQEDYL